MASIGSLHFNRVQLAMIMIKQLPKYKAIVWPAIIWIAIRWAIVGHGATITPTFVKPEVIPNADESQAIL